MLADTTRIRRDAGAMRRLRRGMRSTQAVFGSGNFIICRRAAKQATADIVSTRAAPMPADAF